MVSRSKKEVKGTTEDRISTLPDEIIHHILSFFPTINVLRLSVLSKRWKHLCYTIPFLHLSDCSPLRKKFSERAYKCLELRENDLLNATNTPVSRFKLERLRYGRDIDMDSWLNFLSQSGNLKEIDLHIHSWWTTIRAYPLPNGVLNMRSLTLLQLSSLSLEGIVSCNLPSLVSLILTRVRLNDQILHILLSGCSSLEILRLRKCYHLSNAKFSSLKLKSLEIICYDLPKLEVDAINLRSFVLDGVSRHFYLCNFNLLSCGRIRNLSLSFLNELTNERIKDLILKLPLLECLALCYCNPIKNLEICSQHLKYFVFKGKESCPEAVVSIDTPSLVSFRFDQSPMVFNFSMIAPNILDADLAIYGASTYDSGWYINLHRFLSQFDYSKKLRLRVTSEEYLKGIIFPAEIICIHGPPLPTLKHLKITIPQTWSRSSVMEDALLWLSPSATISVEHSKSDK